MVGNNILVLIFMIITIGLVIYIMYNYENNPIENTKIDTLNSFSPKKTKKQVRFDRNVDFNSHINSQSNKTIDVDKSIMDKNSTDRTPKMGTEINVDRIVKTINPYDRIVKTINPRDRIARTINSGKRNTDDDQHDEIIGTIDPNEKLLCGIDLNDISMPFNDSAEDNNFDFKPSEKKKNKVHAINDDDENNAEQVWYNSFSTPLMDPDDKKKFYAKIQKSYKNYEKSFGEFIQYQMDNDTLIKTDITIDPFKPEKRNNCDGKAIKDIYDEMVAPPKAKPKKIKKKTDRCIIYDDESELNGGNIRGTNLSGFDGVNDGYKSAAFGNEF